jgi:hypothetical protein
MNLATFYESDDDEEGLPRSPSGRAPPRPTSKAPEISDLFEWKKGTIPNFQEASAYCNLVDKIERDSRAGSIFEMSPREGSAGTSRSSMVALASLTKHGKRRATYALNSIGSLFKVDPDKEFEKNPSRGFPAMSDITMGQKLEEANECIIAQEKIITELIRLCDSKGRGDEEFKNHVKALKKKGEEAISSYRNGKKDSVESSPKS